MKRLKGKFLSILSFLVFTLVCSSFLLGGVTTNKKIASAEEGNVSTTVDLDTDTIGQGDTILNYPSLIGNTVTYRETSSKLKMDTSISTDDRIVEIVPKNLFFTVGSSTQMGQEYGYFINTTLTDGVYYSSVLVFDIITDTSLTNPADTIKVTVKPIFQYQFIGISNTATIIYHYTTVVLFTFNYSVNEQRVVPRPSFDPREEEVVYPMSSEYYLKDISFGASLYNENALNYGDEGYDPYNDYGTFFTGFDYSYNGLYYYEEELSSNNSSFDVFKIIISEIGSSIVDKALGDYAIIFNIGTELGKWLFDNGNSSNARGYSLEESNKEITATCFHTNRNDQLENYIDEYGNRYLTKTAFLIMNTHRAESIWYGVGNDMTAHFRVSHSVLDGSSPEYTRFCNQLGVKVVEADSGEVVGMSTHVAQHNLRAEHPKALQIASPSPVYTLPEGRHTYSFRPTLTGNYTFHTEALPFKIYSGYNASTHTGTELTIGTNGVYLQAGVDYHVTVYNDGEDIVQDSLSVSLTAPSLSVGTHTVTSSYSLYTIDSSLHRTYRLTAGNGFIVKVFDETLTEIASGTGETSVEKGDSPIYVTVYSTATNFSPTTLTCQTEKGISYYFDGQLLTTQTVINDGITSLYTPPTLEEGCQFVGWYTSVVLSGSPINANYVAQENVAFINLYAKVTPLAESEPPKYTLEWVLPETTTHGQVIDLSVFDLLGVTTIYQTSDGNIACPTMTENDLYVLDGWYQDSAFTTEVEYIPTGSSGDKTLYAKISMRQYTVSYYANEVSTVYDPNVADYGATIQLPSPTKSGYVGAWYERTGTNDYVWIGEFGDAYTVTRNISLTVQWKQVFNITYTNLTFNGRTASVFVYGELGSAPTTYVHGEGLDIAKIYAYISNSSPYAPTFVFLGWYTDSTFSTKITRIPNDRASDITLYAKWRYDYTDCSYEGYIETITDSGRFNQVYYQCSIALPTVEDGLYALGMQYVAIKIQLNAWEVNDGYQYLFIYEGTDEDANLLWSIEFEHGSGYKDTDAWVHTFIAYIPISDLDEVSGGRLCIRFGAAGNKEDTWKFDTLYYEVSYVVDEEDALSPDFTWNDSPFEE